MNTDASRSEHHFDDDHHYDGDIAGFRQPMVTSLGIIMGFLLAFLANWAVETDGTPAISSGADWVVVVTLLASVALFALVLFRLLDNRILAHPGARYQTTLRVYMLALVLAFSGLGAALFI